MPIFLLFVAVPLVELYILLEIGGYIGFFPTVGIVVATGILGAALARHQGLGVLQRIREQSARGELPAESLVDGLFLLVAGALLITPGVMTDIFGFSLLIPPVRRWLGRRIAAWLRGKFETATMAASPFGAAFGGGPFGGDDSGPSDDVIDVDYVERDDSH